MRRALGRMVRLLVAAVCLCAAASWVRSYRVADVVLVMGPFREARALGALHGRVVFLDSSVPADPAASAWYFERVAVSPDDVDGLSESLFTDSAESKVALGGVRVGRGNLRYVAEPPPRYTAVAVPHAYVVIVTGVPTVLWLRGMLRRRRWVKQGRCRACGYDLRSSPERCPECGEVPRPRRMPVGPAAAAGWVVLLLAAAPVARAADGDEWKGVVVPELDLSQSTLGEALERLGQLTGRNFVVRWPALEGAGLDRNTPVRLHLWNVNVVNALQIVLQLVDGDTVSLGWEEEDGVITVSTDDDLGRGLRPRIYDVRDLVAAIDAPLAPDEPKEDRRTRQEAVDEIIRLITETVDPDAWRDAGGSVGSIRELGGRLVVTQTPANQREVEWLLDELRAAFAKPPPATRPATKPSPRPARGEADGEAVGGGRLVLRVYDVRDLVRTIKAGNDASGRRSDAEREFLDVVVEQVEPLTWSAYDGKASMVAGRLVVTQSPEVHELLARFLEELTKEFAAGAE